MLKSGVFDDLTIALVAFQGAEELDLLGPYEVFWWQSVFQHYPPDYILTEDEYEKTFLPNSGPVSNVFTVGPSAREPLQLSSGSRFIPQYSFRDAPKANAILIPGGHGALKLEDRQQDGTVDYIRSVASQSDNKYVATVCTGAFLAGTLGLLDDHFCQVNHTLYRSFQQQVPRAKVIKDKSLSFVQDGRLITGNAPASGIPTALRLVEDHCGSGYKNNLRNLLAYCVPPVAGVVIEGGEIKHVTL